MSDTIRINALRAYAQGEWDHPDLLRFGEIATSPQAQILHILDFPIDTNQYTIVENCGYEKQKDIGSYTSFISADTWRRTLYSIEDIRELNVAIRVDRPDGTCEIID